MGRWAATVITTWFPTHGSLRIRIKESTIWCQTICVNFNHAALRDTKLLCAQSTLPACIVRLHSPRSTQRHRHSFTETRKVTNYQKSNKKYHNNWTKPPSKPAAYSPILTPGHSVGAVPRTEGTVAGRHFHIHWQSTHGGNLIFEFFDLFFVHLSLLFKCTWKMKEKLSTDHKQYSPFEQTRL